VVSRFRFLIAVAWFFVFGPGAIQAQDTGQTQVNFQFTGIVTQRGYGDYTVRIWNEGQVMHIDYPELSCGGKVKMERQTDTTIELVENLTRGIRVCGSGGFIILTQHDKKNWTYEWSSKKGRTPTVRGSVDLVLSKDPIPRFQENPPGSEAKASRDQTDRTGLQAQITQDDRKIGVPEQSEVDPKTGLALEKGPSVYRIGPTARVTAVQADSPAGRAGVKAGDLIYAIEMGASDWSEKINTIHRYFKKKNSVELWLNRDGEDIHVVLTPAPEAAESLDVDLDGRNLSAVSGSLSHQRFPQTSSALSQLTELAAALGIAEDEVSEAIADGRLNPDLQDLITAFLQLDGISCQSLRRPPEMEDRGTEGPGQSRATNYNGRMQMGCTQLALLFDQKRIDAWNTRFGPRPAKLATARVNPTVVSYFFGNEKTQNEYAQLRCDFTSAAAASRPDLSIFVACSGQTSSVVQNEGLRQLSEARRDDLLGPSDSEVSFRIRLFADGAFEALDAMAKRDATESHRPDMAWVRPLLSYNANREGLLGGQGAERPDYTGLIASYGMARLFTLGPCGDSLTQLTQRSEHWREYRNGFGQYTGRSASDTSYRDFDVLEKFSPMVMAAKRSEGYGSSVYEGMGEVLRGMSCETDLRGQLEANMIAYFEGRPPVYRRRSNQ